MKQAIQDNNFREVSVRFDNYGSLRSEIDINQSLIDGRVASRIAGLYDDIEYKQKPAWNRDERLYVALDVVLFENKNSDFLEATRFRANGETGTSKGTPVEIIPPSVAYHGWFKPIPANIEQYSGSKPSPWVVDPSEGGTWNFQETYNPFERFTESEIKTNTHPAVFDMYTMVFNDPNSTVPNLGTGDGLQGMYGGFPWNSRDTLDSTGLAGTAGAIAAYGPDAPGSTPLRTTKEYHANSPYGEPYAVGFSVPSLMNREVFDYRNLLYFGDTDRVDREFSAENFALEQNFLNNRFGIEMAYDKQHYESTQDFMFAGGSGGSTGSSSDIYVSIAEYLQDGQPNPNLGRAYSRVRFPTINFDEDERETFRTTAFGEFDFTEKEGFRSFLGRHRLTGLHNDYTLDTHGYQWRDNTLTYDFDFRSAAETGGRLNQSGLALNVMAFTSDSLLGLNSMDDVRLQQINIPRVQPRDTFTTFYSEYVADGKYINGTPPRRIETGEVYVERALNNEAIGRTNIESKAISWQSYLLGEHIVGLYGYREDDTESFGRANESEVGFENRDELNRWDPYFTRLAKNPGLVESGDTTTWSVVGRYPETILGELPFGMDFQVHYSEAENFNPIGLRNNARGVATGQPTGSTKEYGFLASFADNKVSLKVNWFETALNDVNAGSNVNIASEAYSVINDYRKRELAGVPFSEHLETVSGNPEDFPIQDYETFYNLSENNVPSYLRPLLNPRREDSNGDGVWDRFDWDGIQNLRSTQDQVSEGFEVEITANPTPSWRIMANISQQESVQSNTAAVMIDVVEEFKQNYEASRTFEMEDLNSSLLRSNGEFWTLANYVPLLGVVALDGTKANEQREWRFTAMSNYEFREGTFKGFSVGGAARWEDEAATGYVFGVDPELGFPVPDVSRPLFDDGLFSGDLWLSYSRKIWDDKVDWKVQLNVRNAFGDNHDIPVKTNPDGKVTVIRIPNPRTIYLSNTFRF